MANQRTAFIDVTRSYIPVDPKAFPENYRVITSEDAKEDKRPIVPYEGYNFMPTSYGYKSYFGSTATLNVDAIPSRVDDVFIFQTEYFENIAVALCEDGIWTKNTSAVGVWTREIVLEIPPVNTKKQWTYCVIFNELYAYRAQGAQYYKISSLTTFKDPNDGGSGITGLAVAAVTTSGDLAIGTYVYSVAAFVGGILQVSSLPVSVTTTALGTNEVTFTKIAGVTLYRIYKTVGIITTYKDVTSDGLITMPTYIFNDTGSTTVFSSLSNTPSDYAVEADAGKFYAVSPNFLNMAGQQGIFKAGSRLGFWDVENSIAWSNLDDFSDFTPAILTQAGNTIFQEILGKIVNIIGMSENFVVYSTKGILLVRQGEGSNFSWIPNLIVKGAGITLPQEVCASTPDTTHFAYTSNGLYKIEAGSPEIIVPEVTDFLKESDSPIYLKVLEGRYLFLQILDATYIDGLVGLKEYTLPSTAITYPTTDIGVTDLEGLTLNYGEACTILNNNTNGVAASQQEQAEDARITTESPAKAPDTFYKPNWACYLSKAAVPSVTDWTISPCFMDPFSGADYPMSPNGSPYNSAVSRSYVYNDDAYIDGWTMERFIAVQSAIWEAEAATTSALINAVTARVSPVSTQLVNVDPPHAGLSGGEFSITVPGSTTSDCQLGAITSGYTGPVLRISPCSFSLFRLGVEKTNLVTRNYIRNTYQPTTKFYFSGPGTSGGIPNPGGYDSAAAAYADMVPKYLVNTPTGGLAGLYRRIIVTGGSSDGNGGITGITGEETQYQMTEAGEIIYFGPFTRTDFAVTAQTQEAYEQTRQAINMTNGIEPVLTPDEPFCTIVSWTYTDVNGVERTIPATACTSPYPTPAPDDPIKLPAGNTGDGGINDAVQGESYLNMADGSICGLPFEPVTIPGISVDPINWTVAPSITPPTSFLLQEGSIGPVYPTIPGALVYDLQLKKWGKMKQDYKVLVDWSPLNQSTINIISYETFGVQGGVVLSTGKITLFDENPIDSYIKYGKIGYYRQGFSSMEEVRLHFRKPSTGTIKLESSLDGSNIEGTLTKADSFVDSTELIFYPSTRGRWHNIVVSGNYDIKYLEFRGTIVGNR